VNGSRRSVELHGLDAAGNPVALGSVTIPVNFDVPAPGAIVEVRYLYAYPGGSLFQPVYRGERTDQPREACTTAQIKTKTAHKDLDGTLDPAPPR
jgi:bifunctional non-homologous end joining protein LigD